MAYPVIAYISKVYCVRLAKVIVLLSAHFLGMYFKKYISSIHFLYVDLFRQRDKNNCCHLESCVFLGTSTMLGLSPLILPDWRIRRP
jgi:hypothetical protein